MTCLAKERLSWMRSVSRGIPVITSRFSCFLTNSIAKLGTVTIQIMRWWSCTSFISSSNTNTEEEKQLCLAVVMLFLAKETLVTWHEDHSFSFLCKRDSMVDYQSTLYAPLPFDHLVKLSPLVGSFHGSLIWTIAVSLWFVHGRL